MSETDIILRDVHDSIATLTLNRPTRLNALDQAMIDALHAALIEVEQDASIRCVVLKPC